MKKVRKWPLPRNPTKRENSRGTKVTRAVPTQGHGKGGRKQQS